MLLDAAPALLKDLSTIGDCHCFSLNDMYRQRNADLPRVVSDFAFALRLFEVIRMDCQIADELIAMAELDRKVGDELAATGALYEGYHPRMAAVHEENAARLQAIIARIGWPTEVAVGERAAQAAWLIAQHAISRPEFQRACLELLAEAAREHIVPLWQPAMLEDRIRMFEGKPQRYGSQLKPDADGKLRPYAIEDPEGVDERRRAVGLEPLAEILARAKPQPVPADPERFEHDYQKWLIEVGWRRPS